MPAREQPRRLTVKVSDDALGGWQSAAERMGVTVTALVEVMGRRMTSQDTSWLDRFGPEARALDIERRRGDRGRRGDNPPRGAPAD